MKLRRVETPRGWTSIPNETLEDRRLSWRARGILAYLLSRPANWETDSERLAAIAKEGRDAVRTALTELEKARYLFRVKIQGDGGLWATEYVLYDRPLAAGTSPGWAPPLDVEASPAATRDASPEAVDNPVSNPVEDCGEPTPENPSPGPGKPTPGNPALLTTTDEQLEELPSATTEGMAAPSVDAYGDGLSPAARCAPSDGAELTLDGPSAAALGDMQRRAPGLDLFALRAHLAVALGDASLSDARRYAIAVAKHRGIDQHELTTGLVLQAAASHVAPKTGDGSAAATALARRQAGEVPIAQSGASVKSQNGTEPHA